jgi:hypothetical protein
MHLDGPPKLIHIVTRVPSGFTLPVSVLILVMFHAATSVSFVHRRLPAFDTATRKVEKVA